MKTQMNIFLMLVVFSFLLLCTITDFLTSKIKNAVVLPTVLVGLFTHCFFNGWQGFQFSLVGICLPFICLIFFYAMGVMGAGDIKLLCGCGACLGFYPTVQLFCYGMLVASVYSIYKMLKYKQLMSRLQKCAAYLYRLIVWREVEVYTDLKKENSINVMRLALFFFIGFIGKCIF